MERVHQIAQGIQDAMQVAGITCEADLLMNQMAKYSSDRARTIDPPKAVYSIEGGNIQLTTVALRLFIEALNIAHSPYIPDETRLPIAEALARAFEAERKGRYLDYDYQHPELVHSSQFNDVASVCVTGLNPTTTKYITLSNLNMKPKFIHLLKIKTYLNRTETSFLEKAFYSNNGQQLAQIAYESNGILHPEFYNPVKYPEYRFTKFDEIRINGDFISGEVSVYQYPEHPENPS